MPPRLSSRSVASCTSVRSSIPRTARSGGGNEARAILELHERDSCERNRPGGVRSRRVALARELSRPLAARMRHRARGVRRQFREGHRRTARAVAPYRTHLSVAHLSQAPCAEPRGAAGARLRRISFPPEALDQWKKKAR